jgi:CheY-like chemotaxis protein
MEYKESILIVEDDESLKNLLSVSLSKKGYKIFTASQGKEAFESILENHPDLVICDIMMPVMDGLELCKKVKEDPQLRDIFFIMLTAKTSKKDRILGLTIGADDYIIKPFSFLEVLARVRAGLRIRRYYKQIMESEKIVTLRLLSKILKYEIDYPLTGIMGYTNHLLETISERDPLFEELKLIKRYVVVIFNQFKKLQERVAKIESYFKEDVVQEELEKEEVLKEEAKETNQ